MLNFLRQWLTKETARRETKKAVEYSVKKYGSTYKWLENSRGHALESAQVLSGRQLVRQYLRQVQKTR